MNAEQREVHTALSVSSMVLTACGYTNFRNTTPASVTHQLMTKLTHCCSKCFDIGRVFHSSYFLLFPVQLGYFFFIRGAVQVVVNLWTITAYIAYIVGF